MPADPRTTEGDLAARVRSILQEHAQADGTPDGRPGLAELLRAALPPTSTSDADRTFQSREVTVLLTDLRGFTSASAGHSALEWVEMLNRYLLQMTDVIVRSGGRIDKFMGDAIMVVFGAPTAQPQDVRNAVTCAVKMQVAMVGLNQLHRQADLPELYMGIGLNTGTVIAGELGSAAYSQYTVIGDEVNLASRIESFSLRGQILISESTFARCADFVETSPPTEVLVKGKPTPVMLREVVAIPSLGLEVPRQEIRRSPRVETRIPFTFQVITNKIVMPGSRQGTIFDIGYHGILAELEGEIAPYSDIKLELDLRLIDSVATDVYAKTLKNIERGGRRLTGIEFTSVSVRSEVDIRHFVQLLMQGAEKR